MKQIEFVDWHPFFDAWPNLNDITHQTTANWNWNETKHDKSHVHKAKDKRNGEALDFVLGKLVLRRSAEERLTNATRRIETAK